MKYIIDTDPGYDDAMAIMLAVKAGLDVIALTTVCGNSTIQNTTNNANHVLKQLKSNIPIFSGASKPLNNDLIEAVVHGENGFGGVDVDKNINLSNNAVEKILSLVEENDEISLIALGPLTNIANAIIKNPKTMSKLHELIIMGGAVKVLGNQNNKVAEFNIFTDPEAAEIVFNSDIKKTVIPLDVCNKIQLNMDDFDQIKGDLKEFLSLIARNYIYLLEKDEGVKSAIMYDPVAVYYCINPDSCKFEMMDVKIETKGEFTRGMTVPELKNKEKNNNIKVVFGMNLDSFKKDFINFLSD